MGYLQFPFNRILIHSYFPQRFVRRDFVYRRLNVIMRRGVKCILLSQLVMNHKAFIT